VVLSTTVSLKVGGLISLDRGESVVKGRGCERGEEKKYGLSLV